MEDIQELFLSGVASAKGGNRRLAQAFFKRVIRKNPLHEGAWLGLAEVLDDPDDIAYCLESALQINPYNEQARVKLDLVHRRGVEPRRPREWSALDDLLDMDVAEIMHQAEAPPVILVERPERSPWQKAGWAALFCLGVLAILTMTVWLAVNPPPASTPVRGTPPIPTIDLASLHEQEREAIRAYFQQVDPILGPLRLARDNYWGLYWGKQHSIPPREDQGELATALKGEILSTLDAMNAIEPPEPLRESHQEFILGLTLEREGLDNILTYLETNQISYANRALVQFQDATVHFDRVRTVWAAYREWAGLPEPTRIPTPTPRSTPTIGPTPTLTPTFRPRSSPTPTPVPTQPAG